MTPESRSSGLVPQRSRGPGLLALLAPILLLGYGCATGGGLGTAAPPIAERHPHSLEAHGHVRTDDYYWLKERDNPKVIDYLEAENTYARQMMAHTENLRDTLYEEIVGRIQPDDTSVPYRLGHYLYYSRFVEGGEYPLYCRRRIAADGSEGDEEVMLDGNELARGHDFFNLRGLSVSDDERLVAFSTDSVGRRFYSLRFKNLESGEFFDDVIPDMTGNLAWAADNRTIFYSKQDPETLRWNRVYRHVLGTDPTTDVLVYEENDETFNVVAERSKSRRFVNLFSVHTLSTEIRFLAADEPEEEFRLLQPREVGHEYFTEHFGDYFYIRTNDGAKNFRLMRAPVDSPGREHWEEVIAHRDDVLLAGMEVFRDHLVLTERKGGLVELRIRPWSGGEGEHYLDFGEPAYMASVSTNPEIDSTVLRYRYSSLTTPFSTFDYHMETRQKTLLKQQPVLGDFDREQYVTERLHAPARDGVEVPVSIVYRKDFPRDGSRPLLLYAYGSYGSSIDPTFSTARLSLLDRGFAYAIAHIRGGQELGRDWYEDGKLLRKMNTFNDFIDVAEYLAAEGYADRERIYALGGSAGGLLMGAIVNLRPDLFHGVIARVPFVDAITTMLDPSIPLTTGEYDEWGDPRKKEYYDYILSYSPYDNVEAKDYPNLLVTTGLHDSQVQYWEPAKWVAKLRAMKTDDNLLLLVTNMSAGHGGASGRFQRHHETAMIYAFLLDLAGLGGN